MFGSEQPVFGGKYVVLPADLAAAMMRCYYGDGPRANEAWPDNPTETDDSEKPRKPRVPTSTLTYTPGASPRKGFQWLPANNEVTDAGTTDTTE